MTRCIVIDDEPLAVKLISNYVTKHENLELIKGYHDPIKALHEIDSMEVHLIFLDIQMPQLSGIQFLKILNNRVPVILTTAYDQYALESYDYKVIDYLVKPISYDRFTKAIDKYEAYHISKSGAITTKSEKADHIYVKSGHKTMHIQLADVKYMESKGDYLHIITKSGEIKTLENLKDIAARLSDNYIRCHRSFIVNMDAVNYIENNRIVIDEAYLPISRGYAEQVQDYIKDSK